MLLVDRGDLGGVATTRSGRVLHCGLQLLQPKASLLDYIYNPQNAVTRLTAARRAALDFEQLRTELRARLEPMTISVPVYHDGPFKGWQVDLGAQLIGILGGKNIGYVRQSTEYASNPLTTALADRASIDSIVSFNDFRFHWPERIAIDAALDAEDHGATLLNFTEVKAIHHADGKWRVKLAPKIAGSGEFEVSARVILNLTGASVDEVIAKTTSRYHVARQLTPVKGVYILVRLPDRYRGRGVAGTNSVGEPITCLPWGELHYIGPTETLYSGDIAAVRPEDEDINFLLNEFNRFAPGIVLGHSDVVMAWAGIRAITAAEGYPKGKRLPFNVVHDFSDEGLPNFIALTWGIVVNHRSTARALSKVVSSKISPSRAASAMTMRKRTFPGLGARLQPDHTATSSDVEFCAQFEHARDLMGVLFARTGLGWTGKLTVRAVRHTAEALAPLLSWDRRQIQNECDAFAVRLKAEFRFELL